MAYPGDPLVDTITIVGRDGAGLAGLTWTFPTSRDPHGATFTIDWVDLGSGLYRFTHATTIGSPAGAYYAVAQANDPDNQQFELEWTLDPATGRGLVYIIPHGGMTRRDLRRSVLDLIGDHVVLTATQSSGSSQWIDEDNLPGQAGRYAGRQLYVTGGTAANIGQTRQVAGSNRQYTLQLARALPAPVQPGDEAELVNTYGIGMTVERVHRTIDKCLTDADLLVPLAYEAPPLTQGTYELALPDAFSAVERVQFRAHADDAWENLKRAKVAGDAGWQIDHVNRAIRLAGHVAYGGTGLTLRVMGYGHPQPLTSETDIAPVDGEWLMYAAAARLLLRTIGVSRTGESSFERKGFYFQQQADQMRDSARVRIGASYTVI